MEFVTIWVRNGFWDRLGHEIPKRSNSNDLTYFDLEIQDGPQFFFFCLKVNFSKWPSSLNE